MKDAMHVTPDGNAVIGLELLRSFGVELPENFAREFTAGYLGMTVLDLLDEE